MGLGTGMRPTEAAEDKTATAAGVVSGNPMRRRDYFAPLILAVAMTSTGHVEVAHRFYRWSITAAEADRFRVGVREEEFVAAWKPPARSVAA